MQRRIAETVEQKASEAVFFKPSPNHKADAGFMRLANDYLDFFHLPYNPTLATQLGVHAYDDRLEDFSKSGIDKMIKALKLYEDHFQTVDPTHLSGRMQDNLSILLNAIRSQLLTLEVIKPWENNPDFYSGYINNTVFLLMKRNFASLNDRLRSVIAREKQILKMLKDAQENLKNPPKILTEIALEQLPGIIDFFKKDLADVFNASDDEELKKQFAESNMAVIEALTAYQNWLKATLLQESKGDFRIGAETFARKLKYDEMVETSLDELLELNLKNMRANQEEFKRIAHEIDPSKTPEEILALLSADYPAPDKLLATFGNLFTSVIQFIHDKNIISIPSDVRPIMQETPPFMRATTLASMDTPGPFESDKVKDAYFNVTLPNPEWSKEEISDFMKSFNTGQIISTTVHETYPGHYIQFLLMQKMRDRVRQIFYANTNAEGWAHYCEQMMLDEGLADCVTKDPQAQKLIRLGQLVDALLRNARFTVGIKMHTGQMTFDEAVDYFVKEGYQPRMVALAEVKRGTSDPTYLYYTLGKLQILTLREEVRAKQGAGFSLKKFHDEFMQQGCVPIGMIRRAMLKDDSLMLDCKRPVMGKQ